MTMPFVILFNKILVIYAPVILLAIFFFVLTFSNLGFNYVPTEELVNDDEESARAAGTNGTGSPAAATYNLAALPPERRSASSPSAWTIWCRDKGYRDSNANMLTLSRMLLIPRAELTRYFEQNLKLSFRIWLSEIRFKAAQEMMRDYPDYSNDIISAECGFSSAHPPLPHLQEPRRLHTHSLEREGLPHTAVADRRQRCRRQARDHRRL